MDQPAAVPSPAWWRLGRLEAIALLLGAGIGLIAAAPLLWLSSEAQRTGQAGPTAAATLPPGQLLLVWLIGSLVGGFLSAQLVRAQRRDVAATRSPLGHLGFLVCGILLIAGLSPLPLALVMAGVSRQPASFGLYYLLAGGLIGWQPGVISFVFLYTFRALEQRRQPALPGDST